MGNLFALLFHLLKLLLCADELFPRDREPLRRRDLIRLQAGRFVLRLHELVL